MQRRARQARLHDLAAAAGNRLGMLQEGTGMPWAMQNGRGLGSWRRTEGSEQRQELSSRGGASGLEVGGATRPDRSKELGQLGRACAPVCPAGFQSELGPVPFFLGPGEALYGLGRS